MKKLLITSAVIAMLTITASAQQLVKSFKVTYDNQLRPVLTVNLHNKLPKQVTHIIYQFSFFDSTGWEDTSVSRSLAQMQSTTITREIGLKPNYTLTDSFLIPQLNYGDKVEPKGIKIIMVRYSDGTVNRSITR